MLLAYFVSQDKLVSFALTSERLITREHPGDIAQVQLLLLQLYTRLDPAICSNLQQSLLEGTRRLLQKLYAILIDPLEDVLPSPGCHLTIVPYGFLLAK